MPVLLLLLLAACNSHHDLCATGNRLSVESATVRHSLVERLRKAGITFHEDSDGSICYASDARDFVTSELVAADSAIYPAGSMRLIGGNFADQVLARLHDAHIDFTVSQVDGYVVVTISETEDVPAAKSLAEEVALSLGNKGAE